MEENLYNNGTRKNRIERITTDNTDEAGYLEKDHVKMPLSSIP